MKKELAVPLLLGLVAALLVFLYLTSLENTYKKGSQKVSVIVAKDYIDQGTALDGSVVEERPVPKEFVQPKALGSMKELFSTEGKPQFITVVPVEKGEQILTTKLFILGFNTGLSSIIPSDRRAVTLPFDGETIAGIIKPGNRVDVIGVFDYENRGSAVQQGAYTVLQNILVLAVGDSFLGSLGPGIKGAGQGREPAPEQEKTGSIPISLALTPREAEILTLASQKGTIRFSLRPTGDTKIAELAGVQMQDICTDISRTFQKKETSPSMEYLKEMQQKQRETLDILRKYQR